MDKSFTLICNNCGAKSTISLKEIMWHEDKYGKYYERDILQEGEVEFIVSYNYEVTEFKCNKCGLEFDNHSRAEYK